MPVRGDNFSVRCSRGAPRGSSGAEKRREEARAQVGVSELSCQLLIQGFVPSLLDKTGQKSDCVSSYSSLGCFRVMGGVRADNMRQTHFLSVTPLRSIHIISVQRRLNLCVGVKN